MSKVCQVCGKPIPAGSGRRSFCSEACRNEHRRQYQAEWQRQRYGGKAREPLTDEERARRKKAAVERWRAAHPEALAQNNRDRYARDKDKLKAYATRRQKQLAENMTLDRYPEYRERQYRAETRYRTKRRAEMTPEELADYDARQSELRQARMEWRKAHPLPYIAPEDSRIGKARIAAGMSQADLADASGYTLAQLVAWETGQCVPQLKTVRRLAAAIGVDWQEIAEPRPGKRRGKTTEEETPTR